jgi:hypothetical protein
LLCTGDTPLVVPAGVVEGLVQRCDESSTIIWPTHPLVVGEAVKVAMGPFDLEGLFETESGRDRVILLIKLLGREVRASVPLRGLAA